AEVKIVGRMKRGRPRRMVPVKPGYARSPGRIQRERTGDGAERPVGAHGLVWINMFARRAHIGKPPKLPPPGGAAHVEKFCDRLLHGGLVDARVAEIEACESLAFHPDDIRIGGKPDAVARKTIRISREPGPGRAAIAHVRTATSYCPDDRP